MKVLLFVIEAFFFVVTLGFIAPRISLPSLFSDQEDPFIYVGNSRVLYNETEMTFYEAKAACASLGSSLVEFWDEQDWGQVKVNTQNKVTNQLRVALHCIMYLLFFQLQIIDLFGKKESFWIGLTDMEDEGTFAWESGHPLSLGVESHWCCNQPGI